MNLLCAKGGTRTHTVFEHHWFLRPACLPIPALWLSIRLTVEIIFCYTLLSQIKPVMNFTLKVSKIAELQADTVHLFLSEEEDAEQAFAFLPHNLVEEIKQGMKREDFNARKNESLVISSKGIISSYKVIITGVGKREDIDLSRVAGQVARSVKLAKECKSVIGIIKPPDKWLNKFAPEKYKFRM